MRWCIIILLFVLCLCECLGSSAPDWGLATRTPTAFASYRVRGTLFTCLGWLRFRGSFSGRRARDPQQCFPEFPKNPVSKLLGDLSPFPGLMGRWNPVSQASAWMIGKFFEILLRGKRNVLSSREHKDPFIHRNILLRTRFGDCACAFLPSATKYLAPAGAGIWCWIPETGSIS